MQAAAPAAAPARHAPWPARLQKRLDAAESAVAALLAVCEEPEAAVVLEVQCVRGSARVRAHIRPAHACLPGATARALAADAARPALRHRRVTLAGLTLQLQRSWRRPRYCGARIWCWTTCGACAQLWRGASLPQAALAARGTVR